jgi:hypothetical protein
MTSDNPWDEGGSINVPSSIRPKAVLVVELPILRLQRFRSLPGHLPILQPKADSMSAVCGVVHKAIARMEQGEVVEDLNIARLELDLQLVLGGREVHHIERFGLNLRHSGNARCVWRKGSAGKRSARVAEAGAMLFEIIQEWPTMPACWFGKSASSDRVSCVFYERLQAA